MTRCRFSSGRIRRCIGRRTPARAARSLRMATQPEARQLQRVCEALRDHRRRLAAVGHPDGLVRAALRLVSARRTGCRVAGRADARLRRALALYRGSSAWATWPATPTFSTTMWSLVAAITDSIDARSWPGARTNRT